MSSPTAIKKDASIATGGLVASSVTTSHRPDVDGTANVERYLAPTTLEHAVRTLSEHEVSMFAGGTDLMVQMRAGTRLLKPVLMNIGRIESIKGIVATSARFRIGALTTISNILNSDELRLNAGVLVEAADCFAGGQIRNSATIGGNLCNASPAGDMIIPLLLCDAEVELASWKEDDIVRRTLPLTEFFTGPGQTRMHADEILTCITLPIPDQKTVAGFRKFGARPAMDIALASVGIAGIRRGDALEDVRVAFGAVAPTPIRGRAAEAALEGTPLDAASISRIARVAEEEVAPISDVRASEWYRRRIIRVLTGRLLDDVSQRDD